MRVMKDYLWRQRTKLEATLAFSMMEPWEKLLCMVIFTLFTLLLISGLYQYLPEHLFIMQRRASYYLWGQDGDERLLRQWVDSPSPMKEL
ncbi:hypothetical protein PISMIDRAFT_677159 [Pisolithus microcarpus 441]|uniref:Uncharacterized protein n=1 Tax=Pisolithus microcarpus 441 TaxID=765257 RepID=A0A0C9YKQ3_9AGAM|nr:hypothetical protein BKA83DRAFT_4361217 [Pisolithus microcarpus]KAI6025298.1 hypothetical protein BKA83DRAFT_677159 [Pisolithus microcarpus]KIK25525.1 hypothetical protein PISMIDRAFT_677159 [Pisolithus microcarpus 441]